MSIYNNLAHQLSIAFPATGRSAKVTPAAAVRYEFNSCSATSLGLFTGTVEVRRCKEMYYSSHKILFKTHTQHETKARYKKN
jgi:hypothetical protein